MIPVRALVTANTSLVVFRKDFITINTIFLYTVLASPGLVWVFLVEFDGVIT